jgi:hypothetical protein
VFKGNRLRIAEALGLTIKVYADDRKWGVYDGKTLHCSSEWENEEVDHEIGHFLAATKSERTKPEWGLDRGPEYPLDEGILEHNGIAIRLDRPEYSKRTVSRDEYESKKESTASLYGIAVTFLFGKKNEWREHAAAHQWDRAEVACDLFCMISDTEHFDLKNGLTKVLAQLGGLKVRP